MVSTKKCTNFMMLNKKINMESIAVTKKQKSMKEQMASVSTYISWGQVARTYFDKSASWFYHKLNGVDGNMQPTEFSKSEKQHFKDALCDLADRIRKAAESIQ